MGQTFMKEKGILYLVLTMSLPMVLSMMVNSLYNIIDSYFVAKISEDAMTALSLVYPLQNLINAATIGFGVGINAVIAYFLGAQEYKKADRAATQGTLLNVLHGLVLMIVCIAVLRHFLDCLPQMLQRSIWGYGIPGSCSDLQLSYRWTFRLRRSFRQWER